MSRPSLGVSIASLGEERDLQSIVGGRADVRLIDVSTPELVSQATGDLDAVIVALQPMTAEHIAAFGERVSVIGRGGVGLDTVDLAAAAAAGVAVVHEPTYSTNEVAHHAAALVLALARQVVASDRLVRERGWSIVTDLGAIPDLQAATLGVVGLGRIGSTVARLLEPFFRRTVGFDPGAVEPPVGVERLQTLDEVLQTADVVTLHLPLLEQTRNLIGVAEIARMRGGALFVNVSRGGLVDQAALAAALHEGRLGGAALDVFAEEPLPGGDVLRGFPNLILTPHIAGTSDGSAARLAKWMLEDVLAHLDGRPLPYGRYAVEPTHRPSTPTSVTRA